MVEEIRRQAETVLALLEVRYEDLVTCPRGDDACPAFLDEPWDEAVLQYERSARVLPNSGVVKRAVSRAISTDAVDR